MKSFFFNIGFRSFIAFFFIFSVTSVFLSSVYINYSYQQGYAEIDKLNTESGLKNEAAKGILDSAIIQLSSFKNLLILGQDTEKYYEHLSIYYEKERAVQRNIQSLYEQYSANDPIAIKLNAVNVRHADTSLKLRDSLQVFNDTAIDPALAASKLTEDWGNAFFVEIEDLRKHIAFNTQDQITQQEKSINTARQLTIISISIMLIIMLAILYSVLDKKLSRPLLRMIDIFNQFGNKFDDSPSVSDLDKIVEQLDSNATHINQILNSSGEALYTTNTDGICTYANPACAKILGYKNIDFLLGKNLHELTHHHYENGSVYDEADCTIYNATNKGTTCHRNDEVFWHKDGHSFPVDYRCYPMFSGSTLIGSVIIFSDITEQRKTQTILEEYKLHLEQLVEERTLDLEHSRDEAIKANNSKDTFLSQMSHELRTPLNVILGFSKILEINKREPLSENQLENVQNIHNAGEHLLDLINQMLDLTQMSSGKFIITPTDVDLNILIGETLKFLQPVIAKKSIRIINETAEKPLPNVYADTLAVKQILINLISNAIKYSPEDSRVIISCDYDNDFLRTSITDHGDGIAAEDQERIFLPFERIHNSEIIEGSGVGLSVCQNITQLMGGKIGVESNQGKGSIFWFELPISKSAVS